MSLRDILDNHVKAYEIQVLKHYVVKPPPPSDVNETIKRMEDMILTRAKRGERSVTVTPGGDTPGDCISPEQWKWWRDVTKRIFKDTNDPNKRRIVLSYLAKVAYDMILETKTEWEKRHPRVAYLICKNNKGVYQVTFDWSQ